LDETKTGVVSEKWENTHKGDINQWRGRESSQTKSCWKTERKTNTGECLSSRRLEEKGMAKLRLFEIKEIGPARPKPILLVAIHKSG